MTVVADDTRAICEDLQRFQRTKTVFRKTRIMNENRLRAIVAGSLGYESRNDEATREAHWKEAGRIIKAVINKTEDHELRALINRSYMAIDAFLIPEEQAEKAMTKLAKTLHVADWVEQEEQRGFGFSSLATVIGECGDLSLYPNPGKVWKRMGCAPFTKGDKTLMGATWKGGRQGKLDAADWEAFGYSPRRRSIAFLIGECLIKGNRGPYRERYDTAKALAAERDDWTRCSQCEGVGRKGKAKCGNCKGTGKVMLRCHRHAMLLATKLLLKNLWIQWDPSRALEATP